MICTFFGHKDTPITVKSILKKTLVDLIERRGVTDFYVGNQGKFDSMVYHELQQLRQDYPHIHYAIALAYMPNGKTALDDVDYENTVFFDQLEKVPAKFAIDRRNRLLIDMSDIVIVYVVYSGGADKFKRLSEKRGKEVINLAEIENNRRE